MNILNLLANESAHFVDLIIKNPPAVELDWIGTAVKWIIELFGVVGVGIILFTVILKTVTLPLDIYQRITSKKQALIMQKMRPQMEKLQKQYANDKNMYNQKVMELQKANGYSIFGACIPMIVTLAIFITVFSGFNSYSRYANLELYRGMVNEYNSHVLCYVDGEDENLENDFLIKAYDLNGQEVGYQVDYDKFATYYDSVEQKYKVTLGEVTYLTAGQYFESIPSEKDENDKITLKNSFVEEFLVKPSQEAAAVYYHNNDASFLWVKNIWYPDSMFSRELPDFAKFKESITGTDFGDNYETSYNRVMGALKEEQNTFNGYFILIILAIGGMLLQQWITTRSQKAVNELSTVDGSGAQTNKMMMIMMPIIYGIFSFFYSASFSIYMITNTIYSLITTLIINKIMEVSFAKKEQREELARYERKTYNSNGKKKK
ncbi:MAG: membrane protein insertase YidC [Clostridia bacterium]|nr:membrane protein insertase YidC [Clostridia bacterium]